MTPDAPAPPPSDEGAWRWAAAGFSFISSLLLVSPFPGWLDSSELVAGAHTLGVVHPPGHPLYCLLAKAAALLIPLGSVAFRIGTLSALCGAAAGWAVFGIAGRAASAVCETTSAHRVAAGLLATGLLCASGAHLSEAARPEVYALNAALVLLALERAMSFAMDGRLIDARMAAVWLGLGLANHHYLVVFALPNALLAMVLHPSGRRALTSRSALGLALLGGAGLLLYVYLPVRAATEPVIDWGHPTTASRFWDVITARTFQGSVTAETRGVPIGDNVGVALGMWADSLGVGVFMLSVLGLAMLSWANRRLGSLLFAALALNVATKAIMFIDPENPDDYGYFYVGIALCAALAPLPALLAASLVQRHRTAILGASMGVLVVFSGLDASGRWQRNDRSHDASVDAFGDALLGPLAPDAVGFVDYYQLYFATWFAQLVEGARPDVTVVQASFDSKRYDGLPYVEALERRAPRLAGVVAAFRAERRFPTAAVLELARTTPVYVEPTPTRLIPPESLARYGLLHRVGADEPLSQGLVWGRLERLARASGLTRDARLVFDWTSFLATTLAVQQRAGRIASHALLSWSLNGEAGPPEGLVTLVHELSARRHTAEHADAIDRPELERRATALENAVAHLDAFELLSASLPPDL